jgi:hypothetical protein
MIRLCHGINKFRKKDLCMKLEPSTCKFGNFFASRHCVILYFSGNISFNFLLFHCFYASFYCTWAYLHLFMLAVVSGCPDIDFMQLLSSTAIFSNRHHLNFRSSNFYSSSLGRALIFSLWLGEGFSSHASCKYGDILLLQNASSKVSSYCKMQVAKYPPTARCKHRVSSFSASCQWPLAYSQAERRRSASQQPLAAFSYTLHYAK